MIIQVVEWYKKNKNQYSGILLAAVVHNQFENIHPFQDGNGRVGRLLMNAILLWHKLPPINIELRHRQEYYRSLQEYQNKGNIRPTIKLMLKEYKHLKKKMPR
jgi:Fic family protein